MQVSRMIEKFVSALINSCYLNLLRKYLLNLRPYSVVITIIISLINYQSICPTWFDLLIFTLFSPSYAHVFVLLPLADWQTRHDRTKTSFSVIIIVAAIAGPLWISTEERIPFYSVNTTFYRSNFSLSYIIKSSNSSLWIFCTRQGE